MPAGLSSGIGAPFQKSTSPFHRRVSRPPLSFPASVVHRFVRSRDFACLALVLCLLALLCTFRFRTDSVHRNDDTQSLSSHEASVGYGDKKSREVEETGSLRFPGFREQEEQDGGYKKYLDDLAPFNAFNLSHPMVGAYAKLAEESLASWTKYEGVTQGVGSRGLVQVRRGGW